MDRDYILHESTTSICSFCLKTIPAKIVIKDSSLYLQKRCDEHGEQFELFEENLEYHLKKRLYDKPGTISKTQTALDKGCPYDCGLCPDHDQHSCISLIEITSNCNLNCPLCFAESNEGVHLPFEQIEKMIDFVIDAEGGEAEIIQISGGEPTTHPQIIEIIEMIRSKNIRYLMLNTNGLRFLNDVNFVEKISTFKGGFEIYLQFDSFKAETYKKMRGKDLSIEKKKIVDILSEYEIPTTLVTTVAKGINHQEIGKIIKYGIKTNSVRGVNLQPMARFGRYSDENFKPITLSGVIMEIEDQYPEVFEKGDIIPLPCNVERVAVSYLAKNSKGKYTPVTRNIDVKSFLPLIDNTFAFDADRILKKRSSEKRKGLTACNCFDFLDGIKSIVPASFAFKSKEEKLKYINKNTFRVSVSSFIDRYNFDQKSMMKECVHVVTPDYKRIPFSAYNMVYRK